MSATPLNLVFIMSDDHGKQAISCYGSKVTSTPGIDRIVMLLCGTTNLREISLFPMNQRAEDLLMGAPSEVSPKQLRELHIRLNLPDTK